MENQNWLIDYLIKPCLEIKGTECREVEKGYGL